MEASLNLANAGYKVYLVEKDGAIGGRMAQLDKTFPTNDCSMCIISPKLVEVGKHTNIEIITCADVEKVEGEEGKFKVTVRRHAPFVDTDKCTGCGECYEVCPVELPNEFDEKLAKRKAVFKRYPQAIPNTSVISKADRAPCTLTCPAGINVQGYVALTAAGKFEEAYNLIKERNPIPAICGRVCFHPCEARCNRKDIDEPVAINPLKRFLSEYMWKKKENEKGDEAGQKAQVKGPLTPRLSLGLKPGVAIVGSGPAGLTAAHDLAKQGYRVKIFEAMPKPGGMLYYGIPAWRLPKDILLKEIKEIEDLGVEIETGVRVGKDIAYGDLRKKGFRAVFIAAGAHADIPMKIKGEDSEQVLSAVEMLRKVNGGEEIKLSGKVIVIGGGNAAFDAARAALRKGGDDVTIAYRRTRQEMPASEEEIVDAEEEGISIEYLTAPKQIRTKGGRVEAVTMIRMELGEPDDSGRRRPVPVEGSEFDMAADYVIAAIGQRPDLDKVEIDGKELQLKWGRIEADPLTLETSIKGVFAGGDAVTGPASVVQAIGQGHEAAESINRFLKLMDLRKDREKPEREPAGVPVYDKFSKKERHEPAKLAPGERRGSFDEIESTFTGDEAIAEAARCLNCGLCCECLQCVSACEAKAIDHAMTDRVLDIDVGSIILAPGFDLFDTELKGEYGYGVCKNVVTSLEFERILSASGPFTGHVVRPSDHEEPKKIAWIQCVGSRDVVCGKGYCSSVCCMYATKEAIMAKDHVDGLETTIFYNDMRTYGKGYEQYYESAKNKFGVKYTRGIISSVKELQRSRNLVLKHVTESGGVEEEEFDMVVLSTGLVPAKAAKELAHRLDVELDEFGFCKTASHRPNETSRKGVYVAGVFAAPKDIPETVSEACCAAALAARNLAEVRGTLVREKIYPPERDISAEQPRIGVFVCSCGSNIASVVDVGKLAEYAAKLPGVVYSTNYIYTCSSDSQKKIVDAINDSKLNRVVVASCTPRTHEPLFQDCLREAGLNKYLFEMANIREQCSWVHKKSRDKANTKAEDLLRMAVHGAARLEPLSDIPMKIIQKALVIGGGLSGMISALNLSAQGFETFLVEKEAELGGTLARVKFELDGSDPQKLLADLVERVEKDPKIKVYTGSRIAEFSGHRGKFKTTVATNGSKEVLEHGITLVATGGMEHKPDEYLYGKSGSVMTQLEFEELMAADEGSKKLGKAGSVVMIQCVGSREPDHPYCSRVCCQQAVKNAIQA
ncbi:MAG: FAD-dependent oxidoreductase, partial [Pseudomonadota bacterium]